MLKTLFFIGLGSFCGGICRFLLTRLMQYHTTLTFPWGTGVVNITGCLFIGLLFGCFEKGHLLNDDLRLFLTVGLCGGFTTFSTFMNENFLLLRENNFLYFILYTAISLVLGLAAVYGGYQATKLF